MAGTAHTQTKQGIIAVLLAAAAVDGSALEGVNISYTGPRRREDVTSKASTSSGKVHEAIWLQGDARAENDYPLLAGGAPVIKDETLHVALIVQVLDARSTATQESVDVRVDALVDAVESALLEAPQLEDSPADLECLMDGYDRVGGSLEPQGYAARCEIVMQTWHRVDLT